MSAHSIVANVDFGLSGARDYWERVALPNVDAFIHDPSARTAFNAATALWHLHEWVLHDSLGAPASRQEVAAHADKVSAVCPELGWLRDINDAAKHYAVGRSSVKVRQMRHVEDFSMMACGISLGTAAIGAGERVLGVALADGSAHPLRRVIGAATKYWRDHFDATS